MSRDRRWCPGGSFLPARQVHGVIRTSAVTRSGGRDCSDVPHPGRPRRAALQAQWRSALPSPGRVQLRQRTRLRPWSCGSAGSQDVARDTHLRLRTAENHVLLDRRAAERRWAPGAAGCPRMTWGRCPRLLAGLPRAPHKSSAPSPLRASVSSSVGRPLAV